MNNETISIIKNIALNLSDLHEDSSVPLPDWDTLTLHSGLPGLALLYGELQRIFPDEGWDEIGNKYLTRIVKGIEQQGGVPLSMFSGAAGIGLAAVCLSEDFKYYRNFIGGINQIIANQLHIYTDQDISNGVRMQEYDVIEGLSGILNYLLLFQSDQSLRPVLESGLCFLVNLAVSDISVRGVCVPGWYVPSEYQFSELESQYYKNGNFNTSMSHGISGPLALLSQAYMQGVIVPNHKKAICRIMEFLKGCQISDEKRVFWKGQISFEEYKMRCLNEDNIVRRDAWCYGSPGICYAMALGAKVLEDNEMLHTIQGVFTDTMHDMKGIFSPTFCHGYAGLYALVQAMQELTGQEYQEEKIILKKIILSYYNKNKRYGFDNIEVEGTQLKEIQSTGLLTGAAGTCLALLSGEGGLDGMLWRKAFLL
ncbi:MAG: hypothetical protein K0R23_628 [Lacrimispora sp.]|jgi:lantibiotic modifying enzyme|nr:hypothetical protein [Lacrimispora sp.]